LLVDLAMLDSDIGYIERRSNLPLIDVGPTLRLILDKLKLLITYRYIDSIISFILKLIVILLI